MPSPQHKETLKKGWDGVMSEKPKPLKSKTMTLHQLQMETLSLIRKMRFQLNRQPWQGGMSDEEFASKVLGDFEAKIVNDVHVLKMAKGRK